VCKLQSVHEPVFGEPTALLACVKDRSVVLSAESIKESKWHLETNHCGPTQSKRRIEMSLIESFWGHPEGGARADLEQY
jgi:hypothetical protein